MESCSVTSTVCSFGPFPRGDPGATRLGVQRRHENETAERFGLRRLSRFPRQERCVRRLRGNDRRADQSRRAMERGRGRHGVGRDGDRELLFGASHAARDRSPLHRERCAAGRESVRGAQLRLLDDSDSPATRRSLDVECASTEPDLRSSGWRRADSRECARSASGPRSGFPSECTTS